MELLQFSWNYFHLNMSHFMEVFNCFTVIYNTYQMYKNLGVF